MSKIDALVFYFRHGVYFCISAIGKSFILGNTAIADLSSLHGLLVCIILLSLVAGFPTGARWKLAEICDEETEKGKTS